MTVLITLTTAGLDSGPFDLYSNVDGYSIPFETNVSKLALQAGYASALVPDTAINIKIVSTGNCINNIIIPLVQLTTSTTSSSTSSTSSTTTIPPSTTTTTTTVFYFYDISNPCANTGVACTNGIYPDTVKSLDNPIVVGSIIRDTFGAPFAGGGWWYDIDGESYVIQINGSGQVTDKFICPP